jgi:hypothetical protein
MATIQLAPPYPVFTDKNGDPLDNGYLYFGVIDLNPETNPIQVYYDSAFTQPAAQPLRTSNGYVMRNGSPALIFAGSQFSVTVRDKNSDLVIYSPVGYGVDPGSIAGVVVVQDHTGDGVTTAFGMGASPSSENATNAYIDGVYQSKAGYSISGSTLTFSEAPPLYSAIEIVSNQTAIIGGTDAGLVTYNEGDTGAVDRTVKAKLQETVSVKDFGAVGDGVTDDTAVIQAAVDSGAGKVLFPSGTYNLKMIFIETGNVKLIGDNATIVQFHDDVNSTTVGGAGQYKVSAAFFTKRGCENVEITGFTFTTNDASFPALAAGYGSYFPSIGGHHSDNIYIHHNVFEGGQDRCMFFQAGKNLRFENNNVENNGFTVHIGYAGNVFFYDATTDVSIKYSPIAPSFTNNIFDGYNSDRSTICAHLTGCVEFVFRDNRFLNMAIGSIGSLRVVRLYSNDFGPFDASGNQLAYIQGVCSGNVINGTFDFALEIDGYSSLATSTWTSSFQMRILVEGNNIEGTGQGIRMTEVQDTKVIGNFVSVTESPIFIERRSSFVIVSNNTLRSTAGGYNDTVIYSAWGAGSGYFTFNNNRVTASPASQYIFERNVPMTWFVCNENNFFFDGDIASCRPVVLTFSGKAWIKDNVFNIDVDPTNVSIFVLTGSGSSASVNIEGNQVFAVNGTGASTIRFAAMSDFKDVNIHNNVTGGPIDIEDCDRVYITDNTMIMPSSNTVRAIACSNDSYAEIATVQIHGNYIVSASATTTQCVAIVSNNDATLNTTSKVTMNYISCNTSAAPLSQLDEGELGVIGNTIINAGAGGTTPTVTGSATLVNF